MFERIKIGPKKIKEGLFMQKILESTIKKNRKLKNIKQKYKVKNTKKFSDKEKK